MSTPKGPAAPASGTSEDIPTFAELAADPEIGPLLDFEPVPIRPRVNGWDADAQRAFIALLAITGSKLRAVTAIGRSTGSLHRMMERDDGGSFRHAQDRALALFRQNNAEKLAHGVAAARKADPTIQAPGQCLNEDDEYEDEDSIQARADDARGSIAGKLLRIRRLYLKEISSDAGKRAAFEILTELAVDWGKAAACEPQPDEPWNPANQRQPDMILTAESGWTRLANGSRMSRRGGLKLPRLNALKCLVNRSARSGTLYAVDNCQRVLTCKASRCLEVGIRIRRSSKLSLTRKCKAGRSSRSKVMRGAVFTALTTTGTGARFQSGVLRRVPATTLELS